MNYRNMTTYMNLKNMLNEKGNLQESICSVIPVSKSRLDNVLFRGVYTLYMWYVVKLFVLFLREK